MSYTRNLSVYQYDVQQVLSGDYDGKTILVAHWTIMDRERLPMIDRRIGEEYEIIAEPFSAHPEIEPERRSKTIEHDLDDELYYDVGN